MGNINLNPLFNANGDLSQLGFQFATDTLTAIKSRIAQQKFYKVAPADYFPVDVGQEAWAEEIVQNLGFSLGGSFFEGDVNTANGNGRLAAVGAGVGQVRMPVGTWAKAAQWTLPELKKAMKADNWDVIEAKLRALKENWDLGIQEVAFLGHPAISGMTGLLNDSEVNINTTTITEAISGMASAEFQTFVGKVLGDYFANSNDTAMPTKFVIPTSDYLGLGAAASDAYPNISKLEYLTNVFKKMVGENFQILPLSYAQESRNKLSASRYVLYNDSDDALGMNIPVDFTTGSMNSADNFHFHQPAYGQYSGVLIARKREVLYFDY